MQKVISITFASLLATSAILHAQDAEVAEPTPLPKWEGSVALGLTLTSGNSDSILFTLAGRAQKKWEQDELSLGLDAAYGEADDVKNNELLRGFSQYNRIFKEKAYGYFRVEGLYDGIADIDYRFTLSPGVGYYFIKKTNMTLSAETGPGFVFERQGGNTDCYVIARVAEKFEYKLNDRARIFQSVEFLPQLNDFNNYVINAEIGVEADITKAWSLRVTLQDTYDNEPADDREKNDLKLIAGLAWKF